MSNANAGFFSFSMCMTELFVKLLIHNLAEVVYDAELAQISYVSCHQCEVYLELRYYKYQAETVKIFFVNTFCLLQ